MRAGVECQFVLWTICSSVDKNTNARQIYTEEIAPRYMIDYLSYSLFKRVAY